MRKEKWEVLQDTVRDDLERIDAPARVTLGSGNVKGDGDVISTSFMVECKQRTRKNIIIEQDHWDKIKKEADLRDRIPMVVCENESGERIVALKLEDLVDWVANRTQN